MTASAAMAARAKAIRQFPEVEMRKHGSTLQRELKNAGRGATGGDGAYSGLGNKPKLGVSTRVVAGGSSATVTLKPSPKAAAGPWRWAEDGTQAGRRSVRRGRRRFSYHHPGTSGSSAWSGPVDRELPRIRADIRRNFGALSR